MEIKNEPDELLAAKALPRALKSAIEAVFAGGLPNVVLVGGTALSGYYACHRRSDDMDLFTADAVSHDMAVRAVKGLPGIQLSDEQRSPAYYHAVAKSGEHRFTVSVVQDPNLFKVGKILTTPRGVNVIALETVWMMKAATLVSRCSEKDLFDLHWLTGRFGSPDVGEWVALGQKIDTGVNPEAILISLAGAQPRLEGCGFAEPFGVSAEDVLEQVRVFRKALIQVFQAHLEKAPVSAEIGRLIRKLKRQSPRHW